MRGFTKTQVNVMLLLLAAILLAICGVIVINVPREATGAVAPPAEHSKIRAARPSLSPHIKSELNIGGSGNEKLTDVFEFNDKLYIFGSTDSADFDFSESTGGGFLCVIDEYGGTKNFYVYGNGGDEFACVALSEVGFVCGLDLKGGGAELLVISPSGERLKQADTLGLISEKIVDIKVVDEKITVITSLADAAGSINLKARIYDGELNLKAERVFSHPCSLEYIELFPTANGYVLAVNLVSPLLSRLAFVTFGISDSPKFYDIDLGDSYGYRAKAVMPYSEGFLALVIDGNMICDVITVSTEFRLHSRIYLRQSSVTDAELFYRPDVGYMCFMKRGEWLSSMFVLDDKLSYKGVIADFSDAGRVYESFIYRDFICFPAAVKGGVRLFSAVGKNPFASISFGSDGMENIRLARLKQSRFLVCEARAKSSDCPNNFGGKDIWIALLRE